MSPARATPSTPITPADIEARFRDLQGEVESIEDDARDYAAMAVVAVVVTVVVVSFLIGRRRGKRRRTVVEIRRV